MLEQIGFTELAIAIVMGLGGYFGRRLVESRSKDEKLERAIRVLDIHEKMQKHNFTPESLRKLEDALTTGSSRREAQLKLIEEEIKADLSGDVFFSIVPDNDEKIETQAELNKRAADGFVAAKFRLDQMISENLEKLPESIRANVLASQDAWEKYAEGQAKLVAEVYEGGSMEPMIYYAEMERLSLARAAEIKDFVNPTNVFY